MELIITIRKEVVDKVEGEEKTDQLKQLLVNVEGLTITALVNEQLIEDS